MTFWESVGVTVVAFVITGVLAFIGGLGVAWARRRFRRADWYITRTPFGSWEVKRAVRRTAFEVRWWVWDENGAALSESGQTPIMRDIDKGQVIGVPRSDAAKAFTLEWIDGQRLRIDCGLDGTEVHVPLRANRQRLRLEVSRR